MEQELKNNRGCSNAYETHKVHLDNLYRMAQYCDNRTDCRRAQILEYFGQIFDRSICIESKMGTTCDNCTSLTSNDYTLRDITQDAISICRGVQQLSSRDNVTLLHLSEILKGSMNSKITEKNHNKLDMHGKLAKYKKNDIERILRKLIFDSYLKEDVQILQHTETVASYIKLGPKAALILNSKTINNPIQIDIREEAAVASKSKQRYCKAVEEDDDDMNDDQSAINVKDSNAEQRLRARCNVDIKRLIAKICSENGIANETTIFQKKMITEMVEKMPTTEEQLLKITYYTRSIYEKYDGEKFLEIFQHYGKLIKEVREEEEKRQRERAAAKLKSEEEYLYKLKKNSTISLNATKNSKNYGLIDSDEEANNSNNWLNSKSTPNSSGGKRKFVNSNNGANNSWKKAKTSSNLNQSDSDANSSSYFKKKNFFKKKYNNFKNYKKK
jgi:superfamily II DNA helicase RecQ